MNKDYSNSYNKKNKNYFKMILFFLLGIFFVCTPYHLAAEEIPSNSFLFTENRQMKRPCIILDPAHGGQDKGVVYEDIFEKNITLDIVKRIERLIVERTTFGVFLTREKDEDKSSLDRVTFANDRKATLFLSFHINAHFSPNLNEMQIYINTYSREELKKSHNFKSSWELIQQKHFEQSKELASHIEKAALSSSLWSLITIKKMPLYLLRSIDMPAVLIELGFLSNLKEKEKLKTTEYQQYLASALYDGILTYISSKNEYSTF